MSPKYTLNKADLRKIGLTIVYSVASAFISTLIIVIQDIDFGAYAVLIPAVNAVLYGAKKFLEGR